MVFIAGDGLWSDWKRIICGGRAAERPIEDAELASDRASDRVDAMTIGYDAIDTAGDVEGRRR